MVILMGVSKQHAKSDISRCFDRALTISVQCWYTVYEYAFTDQPSVMKGTNRRVYPNQSFSQTNTPEAHSSYTMIQYYVPDGKFSQI